LGDLKLSRNIYETSVKFAISVHCHVLGCLQLSNWANVRSTRTDDSGHVTATYKSSHCHYSTHDASWTPAVSQVAPTVALSELCGCAVSCSAPPSPGLLHCMHKLGYVTFRSLLFTSGLLYANLRNTVNRVMLFKVSVSTCVIIQLSNKLPVTVLYILYRLW